MDGYLIVRTYTSNAQLPVEGATVTVTQQTPNGPRLIATRVTDESGRALSVAIDAPALSQSLSPGQAQPWTSVDITIDSPDYDRVLIENAQIFAGIDTQQDVELLPLSETPEYFNMTEIVETNQQEL